MTSVDKLNNEETKKEIASLSEELACILEDRDVPGWLQARIAFVGCKKLGTFGRIEANEGAVRSWITDTLLVDPGADPRNRTAIVAAIDVWQAHVSPFSQFQ